MGTRFWGPAIFLRLPKLGNRVSRGHFSVSSVSSKDRALSFCMGRVHCALKAVHFPELFQGLICAWGNSANEIMSIASRWE